MNGFSISRKAPNTYWHLLTLDAKWRNPPSEHTQAALLNWPQGFFTVFLLAGDRDLLLRQRHWNIGLRHERWWADRDGTGSRCRVQLAVDGGRDAEVDQRAGDRRLLMYRLLLAGAFYPVTTAETLAWVWLTLAVWWCHGRLFLTFVAR